MEKDELIGRFEGSKRLGEDDAYKIEAVRILLKQVAQDLDVVVPDGRAKSIGFTELENAAMWFNKQIANEAKSRHLTVVKPSDIKVDIGLLPDEETDHPTISLGFGRDTTNVYSIDVGGTPWPVLLNSEDELQYFAESKPLTNFFVVDSKTSGPIR